MPLSKIKALVFNSSPPISPFSEKEPESILLIKLGAVGDLVMASPFFDRLRKRFPNARISLLVGRSCRQAVENNPCLDRILSADDNALFNGGIFSRPLEFLRIILMLKKEKFDLAFVMHRAWQFNLLVFLAGIPLRVGFARGHEGVMLHCNVVPVPSRNEREVYLDLLRTVNIPAVYKQTFYFLSREEDNFRERFLARHGISKEDTVIAIGAGGGDNIKISMPTRRWPMEEFTELIERILDEKGWRVILVGGPDDREVASKILAQCPDCVDATDLSFGEMASVFQRCQLFVGNDSGPIHIASAVGIVTIGLYGPTNPLEWATPDPQHTILFKNVECSPCFNNGRFPACDHLTCLRSISVDEVWEKIQQVMPASLASKNN